MSDKATAACVLRDVAKMAAADIAELLHVSVSQVYRYWEAEREARPTAGVVDKTDALLAGQKLDDWGEGLAANARALAMKIDKAATSDIAMDSTALPGLVKEWRGVIAEIMGASEDDKQWLADVFAPVEHSENGGA